MSVRLEICDGIDHKWSSPDIWVTKDPSDSNAKVNSPIVGSPNYVWVIVSNPYTITASNASVYFYSSGSSAGIILSIRSLANFVGRSNVILGPGVIQDILCLTP
jgi:hypothetical protein